MTAPIVPARSEVPDLSRYRACFPSLRLTQQGHPVIYFDNPGGTQVPGQVIRAVTDYYTMANANTHGAFLTSQRTDAILAEAHAAMADFLHAADPGEVIFGANMTTLTFAISRSLAMLLRPRDEVVVTTLDHDANIAPWLAIADERDAIVRTVDIQAPECRLDMEDFRRKITGRTRIVAVGYASNATGTINDIATIIRWAHEVGALCFVDAVHYAPHGPIDVQALDCDFLVCSAYKFFGPHLGILYGKRRLLENLRAYKVRPAENTLPHKFETGTLNHEGIAGLLGTIEYLAAIGRDQVEHAGASAPAGAQPARASTLARPHRSKAAKMAQPDRRYYLQAAMQAIQDYERTLTVHLLDGLRAIRGVTIYGLTAAEDLACRVPTVAITLEGHTSRELAERLGQAGIFTWHGNYYALALMERLGLEQHGGALRIGLAHYNTHEEVDRVLGVLGEI
jgi:cysteine desulfurase family protein (TIGR01976 family)